MKTPNNFEERVRSLVYSVCFSDLDIDKGVKAISKLVNEEIKRTRVEEIDWFNTEVIGTNMDAFGNIPAEINNYKNIMRRQVNDRLAELERGE